MGLFERSMIRMIERLTRKQLQNQKKKQRRESRRELRLGIASSVYGHKNHDAVYLEFSDRLRHLAILGNSGGGKSVALLGHLLQTVRNGDGGLVIDTHDLIMKLLCVIVREIISGRLPISTIQNIWWVDPAYRDWCVRLNPIDCPSPELAPERVARFLRLLAAIWGDVLGGQTQQLTQSVLILLAERRLPLTSVVDLLTSPATLRAHAQLLLNARAKEYFLKQYLNWSRQRQAQVAEAFINKISALLSDPRIAAMLSSPDSDIDFRQAMDEGRLVLISINRGQFFDSASLLAAMILISLQYSTFSRAELPERERRPFYLSIEEFLSFAGTVSVEPFLNEARKFGVGLTLVAQTFAAIDRSLLAAIRANCSTQILFRLSPEDAQLACAGLTGELRTLVAQRLVSLPIGTAMLFRAGETPRILKVENVDLPSELTEAERDLLEQIRHNVGQPMSEFSAGQSSPVIAPVKITKTDTAEAGDGGSTTNFQNANDDSTDETRNEHYMEADE